MPPAIETLGVLALSAAITYPLLLLNIRWAPRLGLVDWPKARGMTQEQIPIIGYGMVLLALIVTSAACWLYGLSPWLALTGAVMAMMGHLDDRKPLPALEKLFWQALSVLVIVFFDPNVHAAMGEKYGIWGMLLAVFFIVTLINAINFIDGIDGLAGCVLAIGYGGAILFSHNLPSFSQYVFISSAILGMLIPFLYLNIVKRKGFLGNVGSYFFGYVVAVIHLSVPINSYDPFARISLNALCFLVPIADVVTVVTSRLFSVRSPFQGDRGHLHHRLVQTSLPLRFVLLNFALIGVGGLIIAGIINTRPSFVHSRIAAIICFTYVAVISLLIGMIEKASKRRIQNYFLRLDSGEPVHFLRFRLKFSSDRVVTPIVLRRLEARIAAEIRVTDVCFAQAPDELYVILYALSEPIRNILGRLEPVFHREGMEATVVLDQGEFLKMSYPDGQNRPRLVRNSNAS